MLRMRFLLDSPAAELGRYAAIATIAGPSTHLFLRLCMRNTNRRSAARQQASMFGRSASGSHSAPRTRWCTEAWCSSQCAPPHVSAVAARCTATGPTARSMSAHTASRGERRRSSLRPLPSEAIQIGRAVPDSRRGITNVAAAKGALDGAHCVSTLIYPFAAELGRYAAIPTIAGPSAHLLLRLCTRNTSRRSAARQQASILGRSASGGHSAPRIRLVYGRAVLEPVSPHHVSAVALVAPRPVPRLDRCRRIRRHGGSGGAHHLRPLPPEAVQIGRAVPRSRRGITNVAAVKGALDGAHCVSTLIWSLCS